VRNPESRSRPPLRDPMSSSSIPDDKIQEIRERVDIIDLVGRYVELRRAGRNWKGLCPFHDERTASFNVHPERKGYKCFGCGAGGDAIRFVMEIEGKSFPEAVRKLAELYGVTLPPLQPPWGGSFRPGTGSSESRAHEKDEAYAILKAATELYESILRDRSIGAAGRDYLTKRGLTSQIAQTFRLGYAPAPAEAGWDNLVQVLRDRGLSIELAAQLGLVGRSERSSKDYDKFRGRLMFPVIAPGGEVIAFSGRIVPPHDCSETEDRVPPKYVNSSESILYTKGKTLFALATARAAIRASRRAILVEGNIDVVKLHQWGHAEAVAPLGTAVTADQARLLARFAEEVVMCFDGDKAGKKAAWSALPLLLEADLDVRMVLLPEGEDPDSLGQERFLALLDRAKPALEEMMIRIAAKAGDAAHARGRALDRVVPFIAAVRRDTARDLFVDRASELFGLPASRVQSAVKGSRTGSSPTHVERGERRDTRQFPSISHGPVTVSAAVPALPPLPVGQAQLTMLLVDIPHLAAVAERCGALECIRDARLAPIARALVESTRTGKNLTMPELLELIDKDAQQQVFRRIFAGGYRTAPQGLKGTAPQGLKGTAPRGPKGTEQGTEGEDPQAILDSLVLRCREDAIQSQIGDLDRRITAAQDDGFPEKASALAQARLELRRQQDALRHGSAGSDRRAPS